MKRNAGFTLIELVVVIVILGILAITAAPKFLNMQGDAREATLNGVKAAIQSASAMVHAKAVIAGQETASSGQVTINNQPITTVFGYPSAANLIDMLHISATSGSADTAKFDFVYDVTDDTFTIWPKGDYATATSNTTVCNVTYSTSSATSSAAPTVKMNPGC